MPHRRGGRLELVSLAAVRRRSSEVCLRKIRRARSQDDGRPIRRPEAQSAPDADRRRRPSREMVLSTQAGLARLAPHGRIPPPYERAGDVEVEKLEVQMMRSFGKGTFRNKIA